MANFEKLLSYEEFEKMKIPQYKDILISKDMACPECDGSNLFSYSFDHRVVEPRPVGWCDTEQGFMACFECPKCFMKYRFHISTTGRYDLERFYEDFALLVDTYKFHYKYKVQ